MLAFALGASAADAATQSRDDPSDAPGPENAQADLRRVAWDVTGSAATLTVSLDDNSFAPVAVHLLMDTGADGLADEEVVATRDADGKRLDVTLRELSHALSTTDCQDLAGKNTSAQATVPSTVSGGLETFAFSFDPTVVAGGLASFTWAAFGQAPDFNGAWDLLPDASNPAPGAPNPGDRRCNGSKSGLGVRVSAGVAFPDPAPPQPTPPARKHEVSSLRVAKTTKLEVGVAGWITTRRIAGKPRTATLRKVTAKRKSAKRQRSPRP